MKKPRLICFVAIALFVFGASFTQGAVVESDVQSPVQDVVALDGETYERLQILEAFLKGVFTKDTLNEGSLLLPLSPYNDSDFYSPAYLAVNYPWLYHHIFPDDGGPRLQVVNKWEKPIQISLGMPNDLEPFSAGPSYKKYKLELYDGSRKAQREFRATEVFDSIQEYIEERSQVLSDITNLDIRFVSPEQETRESFANVRINLVPREHFIQGEYRRSKGLKRVSWSTGSISVNFRENIERNIQTGFVYTSRATKQVDGYFLVNAKNEINMAVCYIWRGHGLPMLRALINECLVRSLGIPGAVDIDDRSVSPKGVLTLWNGVEAPLDTRMLPTELSEFDRYILQLLYLPSIRPGMSHIDVQKLLLGTE